jgi:Tfp pilus assembly protein PilX
MSIYASSKAEQGAVLVVGMIMLVVMTLLVTAGLSLSSSNLIATGNLQFRNEAIASANFAIDEIMQSLLSSGSTVVPPAQTINVDINNDGADDYLVTIAAPVCVMAKPDVSESLSSVTLPTMSTLGAWNTIWDVSAVVTDVTAGVTGVSVELHQGIRVQLSDAQKTAVCN